MSRQGACWDNALAESFFATLGFELIELQAFNRRQIAKTAEFEFIKVSSNRQRAHQTQDDKTPMEHDYRLVA